MSKYYGQIGFSSSVEDPTGSGIWKSQIVERSYYGEVNRNIRRWGSDNKVNGDIDISNEISILSDAYAYDHVPEIKYVTWLNNKWEVSSIEVQYPRLLLTVGGLYNG